MERRQADWHRFYPLSPRIIQGGRIRKADHGPDRGWGHVAQCVRGKKPSYIKISDRKEWNMPFRWQKREIIVLAGKGHESYQEIKGIGYPVRRQKK